MSLSAWLRDYLYISLGGSRGGKARTLVNLFLTMLLGGLWHGASWTFVVWGALHGAGLVVERLLVGERGDATSWWGRALGFVVTFHVVVVAWVFFRADSFTAAARVLGQVVDGWGGGSANLTWPVVAALVAGFGSHMVPTSWRTRALDAFARAPALVPAVVVVGALYVLRALSGSGAAPFIYFQF
jgi:hypothetical protein